MTMMLEAQPVPIRERDGIFLVGGSRVPIDTVIRHFNWGDTPEEIIQQFTSLKLNDVYGVINHYLNNKAEVDAYLVQRQKEADNLRQEIEVKFDQKGFRQRLLSRLTDSNAQISR